MASLLIALLALDGLFPPSTERTQSLSWVMEDDKGSIISGRLSKDEQWRLPITLDRIPPLFVSMVIAFEDKRFFHHFGIDPAALIRAVGQLIMNGHYICGASTITMQLARLLEPRPRTLKSKIIEMVRAMQLEWRWSKERILTNYLILAPYGGNIQGLRAACHVYFNKEPKNLHPDEMALLVAIPQSPTRLRPHHHRDACKRQRDKVLSRMKNLGILTHQQWNDAIQQQILGKYFAFPNLTPHLLNRLISSSTSSSLIGQHSRCDLNHQFRSHIQTPIQKMVMVMAKTYLEHYYDTRENIAVMVVDNKTMGVVAYVGSAAPFSLNRHGYIDMIKAVRSPGSTLKPFIYGIAFEEKLAVPSTLIHDVATNFAEYAPLNFGTTFNGTVTIAQALQQSLNIPVVSLLQRIGPERFSQFIQCFGITLKTPKEPLSSGRLAAANGAQSMTTLPIALGGVGMRLDDLVSLYAALSRGGQFSPLHFLVDDSAHQAKKDLSILSSKKLLDKCSARWITNILQQSPLPPGFVSTSLSGRVPISFKTGTSYGGRDVWCFGYFGDEQAGYTVGVWMGCPDGTACVNNVGRLQAAPLALMICEGLQRHHPIRTRISMRDEGILNDDYAIVPKSLQQFRGIGVIGNDHDGTIQFLGSAGRVDLRGPQIIKPTNKSRHFFYLVDRHNDTKLIVAPIQFEATAVMTDHQANPGIPHEDKLFWMVDGVIAQESRDKTTWWWTPPGPGFYTVSVVNSDGVSAKVDIQVITN